MLTAVKAAEEKADTESELLVTNADAKVAACQGEIPCRIC